jgi:hypothetical protein
MKAEQKRENARRVHALLAREPELEVWEKAFLQKVALIRRGKLSQGQLRALDSIYSKYFPAQQEEARP